MTTPQPDRPRGPAGMPAHLWDLACSDVRMSVPERIRGAVANGMNAPEGVRRIAARVAAVGAAVGIPAALIGVGATPDGVATSDAPVDLAGGEAPLDALDPVPPAPGSESSGQDGGPTYDIGPDGGYASQTTTGTGDVGAGMGTTWHVQEPGAEPGEWLTVQMFQDVTVTETADGMFIVDAYQYIVIRDDDGNEYVFTEHYQVIVPDPPGQETDLVIHERGFVHVIENPDGSFRVDSTDHGIDVVVTSDGDGRDEVGITQSQGVKVTDKDRSDGTDVTVDLNEKAISTSKDIDDQATTTIKQGQVFTDGDLPPEPPWKESTGTGASKETSGPEGPADGDADGPTGTNGTGGTGRGPGPDGTGEPDGDRSDPFGESAGRQTTAGGTPATAGNSTAGGSPAGGPVGGGASGGSAAGGSAVGNAAPLSSTIAVAAPVTATTAWQTQAPASEVRLTDQAAPTQDESGTAGPDRPADEGPSPFVGGKPAGEPGPFDPGTPTDPATGAHPAPGDTGSGDTATGHTGTGDTGSPGEAANAGPPEHETGVDQVPDTTTPVEHAATERTDDQAGGDTAHTGTGGDGADHALVS